MYWPVLVASGVLEAVWATALGRSEGFTRLAPAIVFAVALAASMAGLAVAMRGLPIGTAYAVWVGIGAALTAGYAMWSGQEPVSAIRILLLAGVVGCVVGLKLTRLASTQPAALRDLSVDDLEPPGRLHRLEHPAVVGDQQQRPGVGGQRLLELLDGGQVEVVGRLVQDQHVDAPRLQQRERRPRALAG